jgi:hypothetical protein
MLSDIRSFDKWNCSWYIHIYMRDIHNISLQTAAAYGL